MPTSNGVARKWRRKGQTTTTATLFVALSLLALAWIVPLSTRNSEGEQREMTALEIWFEMLGNLPADAPTFLHPSVIAALSVAALILSAYIIVAIARLPG